MRLLQSAMLSAKQDVQQPGDPCTVPLVPKAEELGVSSLLLSMALPC